MNKKETIKELRKTAKKLGKSPGRREIPSILHWNCLKHFKYFNKAKQAANLKIVNVKCKPLLKNAYKLDKDLAKIAAYLTTDGHLCKDLNGFYFSSKDINALKEFEKLIYKKFKIKGRYNYNYGVPAYEVFNFRASRLLNKLGIPAGEKVLTKFDVPSWVKNNKQLAREYLKILFYCEGSKFQKSKNTETIRIGMYKEQKLLKNGIKFMNSLKNMFKMFNIETTKIWSGKGNIRNKDNKITKPMIFQIKANSINTFIKEISWIK